jgi:RHS repeat-associated protein
MTNAAAKGRSLLFLAAAFALFAALLAAPAAEATRTLPALAEPAHAHQRATLDVLEDATPKTPTQPEKRLRLFDDPGWPTHPLELVQISKTASGVFDLGLGCNILEKGGLSQDCGSPSFQGLWHDPTTGLAYARNRWYDARTASWLSEDPLGPVDSPNLYAGFGLMPHSARDPMGNCIGLGCYILFKNAIKKGEELAPQAAEMAADVWNNRWSIRWGMAESTGKFLFGVSDLIQRGEVSGRIAAVDAFVSEDSGLMGRVSAAWDAYGDQKLRSQTFGLSDIRSVNDLESWAGEISGTSEIAGGAQKIGLGLVESDLALMAEGAGDLTTGGSKFFTLTGGMASMFVGGTQAAVANGSRVRLNLFRQPGQPAIRNAGLQPGLASIAPRAGAMQAHHSDPKFMGGDPDQPLTDIVSPGHRLLHKWLNQALRNVFDDFGQHMRPQRGNSGAVIRQNFSRQERLEALADFYKYKEGAMYTEAARDFFKQHPELRW